jgi:hypothetical protein
MEKMKVQPRKIELFLILAAALLFFSCSAAPSASRDGKLQGEIAGNLYKDSELSKVIVIVKDGIVDLSGEVSDESARAKAENFARIEGVREIRNNISVAKNAAAVSDSEVPINKPEPLSIEEQVKQEADDLGRKYWNEMLTRCGESYFWKSYYQESDQKYYEGKGEPQIWVEGAYYAPRELTKADQLNEVDAQPSEYRGTIKISFETGRLFKGDVCTLDTCSWKDNFTFSATIEKSKGKWLIGSGSRQNRKVQCEEVEPPKGGSPVKVTKSGKLLYPGNHEGWYSIGKGALTIGVYGAVCLKQNCANASQATVAGWMYMGDKPAGEGALAPNLRWGALIAKIGKNGEPFAPFTGRNLEYHFDTKEEIFIGINDSDYTDNGGEFGICIFPFGTKTSGRCTS